MGAATGPPSTFVPCGLHHVPCGGALTRALVDTVQLSSCKESVGKLAVPEKVEAVAHGDVNMSVENFLTKAIA